MSDQNLLQKFDLAIVRKLFAYLKPYKRAVIVSLVALLVSAAA